MFNLRLTKLCAIDMQLAEIRNDWDGLAFGLFFLKKNYFWVHNLPLVHTKVGAFLKSMKTEN